MMGMASRVWSAFSPPATTIAEKKPDALKFGILGAANIAPLALIGPSKTHPEVILQAVSARDRKKAEEFAKANGVAEVKDSYQEILDDPNIDCIFIPLPNGFHFEWACKAIKAGKHVLLEKPSVSNYEEAQILFGLPELNQPNGPILLEAFHNRFHPAFQYFRSLIDPPNVEKAESYSMIPWWGSGKDDIHFNYNLSGGTMMAMGTYNFAALRVAFGAEPEECISCDTKAYTDGVHHDCDYDFKATFRFPGGRIGEASSTLQGPTVWTPSFIKATHKEEVVADEKLPETQIKVKVHKVAMHGLIHAIFWHRIDIEDHFEIRNKEDGKVIKQWTEKKSKKVYSFQDAGGEFANLPGEVHWMSYRHQLEQFVNKIKGRPVQTWIENSDSLNQMKMLDMAYTKSGLGPRPSSKYRP